MITFRHLTDLICSLEVLFLAQAGLSRKHRSKYSKGWTKQQHRCGEVCLFYASLR